MVTDVKAAQPQKALPPILAGSVDIYINDYGWNGFKCIAAIGTSGDCPTSGISGEISWRINASNTLIISRNNGNGVMPDYYSNVGPWAVHRNSITALVIETGVTSIGAHAFYNLTNISGSLTLPEGLTSIGYRAFHDCNGFTGTLTLPQGLTIINEYAFSGCSGLTEVIIPNSVTGTRNIMSSKKKLFNAPLLITCGVVL